MKDKGVIYERCKLFSRDIVELCRLLNKNGEFVIAKQIIRSATSIGANYSESLGAESPNDFIHKLSISIKEAYETQYWLDILKDSGYIDESYYNALYWSVGRAVQDDYGIHYDYQKTEWYDRVSHLTINN